MEMLRARIGGDLTHVTYRGFPQLAPDPHRGAVDASFAIAAAFLPTVREGRVRAIGVTARRGSPARRTCRRWPKPASPASNPSPGSG
jgi:tripartite-type tricarboxylate transporter receptor subunit TctC